jgi:hypothetical protein
VKGIWKWHESDREQRFSFGAMRYSTFATKAQLTIYSAYRETGKSETVSDTNQCNSLGLVVALRCVCRVVFDSRDLAVPRYGSCGILDKRIAIIDQVHCLGARCSAEGGRPACQDCPMRVEGNK